MDTVILASQILSVLDDGLRMATMSMSGCLTPEDYDRLSRQKEMFQGLVTNLKNMTPQELAQGTLKLDIELAAAQVAAQKEQ
jgi:hypothetical protein